MAIFFFINHNDNVKDTLKRNTFYPSPIFYKGHIQGISVLPLNPKKGYSENRKKKGGMTRKARCLCEKDFLEKSLSPTNCCSLKYSELRLRQAMAPADRQKGRPIS